MSKIVLLNHPEIVLKLERIAWQIAEEFYGEKKIILIGLKNRGFKVASRIHDHLSSISSVKLELVELSIDKKKALSSKVSLDKEVQLKDSNIVLIDDVLNSGITLSGALAFLLQKEPKSVKVAVLANRDHKAFPINADFVGVSVATTLMEHISFVDTKDKMTIYLD